jgi:hypothetical protein
MPICVATETRDVTDSGSIRTRDDTTGGCIPGWTSRLCKRMWADVGRHDGSFIGTRIGVYIGVEVGCRVVLRLWTCRWGRWKVVDQKTVRSGNVSRILIITTRMLIGKVG